MTDRTARIIRAFMLKRAAAILTPEAEQAAMTPQDPAMGGAPAQQQGGAPMPPQDPAAMGGAPAPQQAGMPPQGPQGSGGGQIPPELLNDQGFIQWLAQQGVQFDPQSMMFYGPDGQPLPVEAIMQAYDAYMQETQGQAGGVPQQAGGQMPPDGGQMPPDGGQMPPDGGQMPPDGGQLPPEIMQDQQFMDFMQQAMGVQFDPNSGSFIDPQAGQPIPPDMIMQAYQQFQQQMGAAGGAQGGAPGADGTGEQAPGPDAQMQQAPGVSPEVMDQFQSAIDASLQAFTQQLDKKMETLLDKLETVKMALESMRDTDDQREKQDREETKRLQDELAAELNPQGMVDDASVEKTASVQPVSKPRKAARRSVPENLMEILLNPVK